ncbi:MAG: serine/threonine-protein kinase [Gemmataceae bacterium]
MKLIRGRTLAALLADRPDPSADLSRFLHVFEQIAQTLAAAHAHGVIHRDLKPGNVMVGPFNEVQVMDWGLAKVLGAGGEAEPTADPDPEDAAGREADSHTRAGSVLGTPAYMPPEQARGEIDRVDRRADVFALGAVLCEVLTGRPVYAGATAAQLAAAAAGKVQPALEALAACGGDPDLVGLAGRCLDPDPAGRPADAGEVAVAVAAHRTGVEARLRQAEVGRAAAEATAVEQRKRRRVQLALGLVVLAVSAAATAVWVAYVHQENATAVAAAARRARVAAEVAAALDETRERAAEAWTEEADPGRLAAGADLVVATLQDAERSAAVDEGTPLDPALAAALAGTRAAVDDLTRHARLVTEADRVIREHAERLNPRTGAAAREANACSGRRLAEAFRAFGLDPSDPARAEAVGRAVAADRLRDRLIGYLAELEAWTPAGEDAGVTAVLRAARLAAGGAFARWQAVIDAPAGLEAFAADPDVLALGPVGLAAVGRQLHEAGRVDAWAALLRRAVARYPADAWLHHDLAEACGQLSPPQRQEAVRHAAAAAVLLPASGYFRTVLGYCLHDAGATAAAVACWREALALDPGAVFAFTMLAAALHEEKDAAGVEAAARAFLAHNPDLSAGHFWLGAARGQLGDTAGAATALLAAADRFRPDDADADDCRMVAEHLAWAGRPMAALHLLTRSLAARPDWATGPERLRVKAAALAVRCGTGDAADAPPADDRPQLVHQRWSGCRRPGLLAGPAGDGAGRHPRRPGGVADRPGPGPGPPPAHGDCGRPGRLGAVVAAVGRRPRPVRGHRPRGRPAAAAGPVEWHRRSSTCPRRPSSTSSAPPPTDGGSPAPASHSTPSSTPTGTANCRRRSPPTSRPCRWSRFTGRSPSTCGTGPLSTGT